ncbi:hypothetical protein ORV05_28000 [Amycolatopsis cynarae]|uniref:Transcriptional regulator n=1 Tax=Amycolatopsis cynarae TaxID=2995223 RepID=A0ABY7AZX8_9PSEU|nr:hypothetical protein [Amycolatopsis sp. HUAS 11-8]WAL64764.1 hypothetical protein ORV05_28000 [Amycolatopsis sp. HUAS 11-8]
MPSKQLAPDHEALIALFPEGVAPRATLVALGLSHSTISARCRPGRVWQRPIPGVIVLNSDPLSRAQLHRAALVHAGARAMITGIEAARLHGLTRLPPGEAVHVLVPHTSGVSSWGFATVERTIHLPAPVVIERVPVAPLARALFDAARRMTDLSAVRAMIKEAVGRGLCDPRDLQREIESGSTIGSALPRRVVHEIHAAVRSASEAWAREILRRSGLPEPEWQVELEDQDGVFLGHADAYWAEVGLLWRIAWAEFSLEDQEPNPAPAGAGAIVVETLPSQLRDNPLRVIEQLRKAYETAAGRPPPPIRISGNGRRPSRSAGPASSARRHCG